jgi:hypothetical protein
MVENPALANIFRLSIKSVEHGLDPKIIHAGVQALHSTISSLSNLEHTAFSFSYGSQRGDSPRAHANSGETTLCVGLCCEAPLDKFRVVLQCVGHWLDRTAQKNSFEVEIPPAHTISLQTHQAKVLAQLLPLGEALLLPHEIYCAQAEGYVNIFGELTPITRANLSLVRQRMRLSTEETNELNARAMGPFKTLAEKYQHFRKELLACKQESDLDGDFWKVMQTKAATMSLPEADAQFLKAERLNILRSEADQARQQAEVNAEAERQRHREQQQRLVSYRQTFEELVINSLHPQCFGREATLFRQGVMVHLSDPEFNRGRLTQAREFYRLNQQEADALEKSVLDELYLLSGLL